MIRGKHNKKEETVKRGPRLLKEQKKSVDKRRRRSKAHFLF